MASKKRIVSFLTVLCAGLIAFGVSSCMAGPVGIHGSSIVGVKTNRPFLYLIPATGPKPLHFRAQGLPPGLWLNSRTGIIEGRSSREGRYTVELSVRSGFSIAKKKVEFVVGEQAVALTPIMGWNPWYVWGCNIDDAKIRQAADLLVSSGLAAHGFNYINIDDCWAGSRDHNGEVVPNSHFPNMTALANYVHSKGLHIGIYTSPNTKTCGGFVGSQGHVEQDVQTYSRWGMDLIKYDWCHDNEDLHAAYQELGDAIAKAPRALVDSMCEYGKGQVWTWGTEVGGNSWRTNDDLADVWDAVVRNGFDNVGISSYASPGHFNDLDFLIVGKGNWPDKLGDYDIADQPPHDTRLTPDEQLTHLSLWSLMASPLVFSGDLAQLDPHTIQLLTNDDVIAIDQDPLVRPVKKIVDRDGTQVLTRELADGSIAVGLFNLNNEPMAIEASLADMQIPAGAEVTLKNVWTQETSKTRLPTIGAFVPAHGVVLYKVMH